MSFQWVCGKKNEEKRKKGEGKGKREKRRGKEKGRGKGKRGKRKGKRRKEREKGREKENILWVDPGDTNLYNIFARFLMMVLCVTYSGLILRI